MNDRDFIYWLQGYFELSGHPALVGAISAESISQATVKVVRSHIELARNMRETVDECSVVVEYIAGLLEGYDDASHEQQLMTTAWVVAAIIRAMTKVTPKPEFSSLGGVYDAVVPDSIFNNPTRVQGISCSLAPDVNIFDNPTGTGMLTCSLGPVLPHVDDVWQEHSIGFSHQDVCHHLRRYC